MALQAEQPVSHGIIALLFQQGHSQELALGLGHFAVIRIQVMDMEPVVAPLVTQVAFGLGNFVGVMRKGIVNAAAVDVQIVPQMLHGNAGALNVPAGIAHAPGRIPLESLILELGLGKPENEVVLILLVLVLFHALPDAHGQVFLIVVIEDVVLFQFGGIEVHVAPGKIGIALVQQRLDHVDILGNAVRGRLHHIRTLDVQLVAVGKEGIGVVFGNFHDGLVLPLGTLDHLILAGVRVGGQMAHVRDVHDPLDGISQIAQGLFQHILHNIGAQIADVGKMVNRGAAGVHLHQLRVVGNKQFLLVGQRVV